jgi:uncharacterized protein
MYILKKNLELISGNNLNFRETESEDPEEFFSLIPVKKEFYLDRLDSSYYVGANFNWNAGPVVLNYQVKKFLDLVDGKSSIKTLWEKICQPESSFSKLSFREALYFLGKKSIDLGKVYDNFLYGRGFLKAADIVFIFFVLESAGFIKFSGAENRKQETSKPGSSISVRLHLTDQCNLACDYCYLGKQKREDWEMDMETGRRIVDKIHSTALKYSLRNISLKFAGGEPLLKLSLVLEICDYALEKFKNDKKIKLNFAILTNGTLINEENAREIKKIKIGVGVSLDGTKKWHNLHAKYASGAGSFSQVDRGISILLSQGVSLGLSAVINADNLGGITELFKYANEKRIRVTFTFVRKNPEISNDLLMDNERLVEEYLKFFQLLEKNLPKHYSIISSLCDNIPIFSRSQRFPCGVGENYVIIGPDGSIVPCVMNQGDKKAVVGHIKDSDDLLSLIRKPEVQKRNPLIYEKNKCTGCSYLAACHGGCPSEIFFKSGDYTDPSPYCEAYKKLIPRAMKLMGKILLKQIEKIGPAVDN